MVHACVQLLLFLSTLLSGSMNTISRKIQFQTCAPGLAKCPADSTCHQSSSHHFNKPWLQTQIMFIAEFFCLPFFLITKFCSKQKPAYNPNRPNTKTQTIKEFGLFLCFSMLDLTGSILATIGLMYINSSIYQLFRGSIVIFTGIWSILFLKRKLNYQHWTGMVLVVIGLFFVGFAGFMNAIKGKQDLHAGWTYLLGILLIVGGQVASSFHYILQEKFLKGFDLNPLYCIGIEGFFGLVITSAVAFPIVSSIPGSDCTKYENVGDGYVMMSQNGGLLAWNLISLASLSFFNGLGVTVSKHLSSIHRTLIDACRAIVVWVCMLIVYYASKSKFGESWDKYTYYQLIGFAFLVLGTLLYNRVFVLDKLLNTIIGREYFHTVADAEAEVRKADAEKKAKTSEMLEDSEKQSRPLMSGWGDEEEDKDGGEELDEGGDRDGNQDGDEREVVF